ncbi:MAG TPA: SGNH/GDSL hydrolase family protein [Tepidisphaeraceae bacterium]|jgi:lysophospholipase L1-like esterase|nr:SGNH/GDSL hydrolase family protein [Tepidisphaeraceae bacterium]
MPNLTTLLVLLPTLLLLGCHSSTQITGDTLVLPAAQPGNLLYTHIDPASLHVHSMTATYAPSDYTLDPIAGTLARTPNSQIPDYSKNSLYNQKDFDHSHFPGYGNTAYTIYLDYKTTDPAARQPLSPPTDVSALLPHAAQLLHSGEPLKLIAYGDSITAGGEATSVNRQFPSLYADYLRHEFPKSTITLENTATGGDTTANGIARLSEKVLSHHPDLVLVAFGMNDHNIPGFGTPLPQFTANLTIIVNTIKSQTHADVILLSCFPPNPNWHFGSHNMAAYAHATQTVAAQTHCAYADVYATFEKVLARKDVPSLLGNNINHPNNFGHYLYLQTLESLHF